MKKQIKSYKYLRQFIVVFGLFIIFPHVITAQNTREQIENRITLLDNEIKRLTYKREAIGLEFEAISNFSMQARPILVGYNEIIEAIKLKDNEISNTFWKPELREKKEAEYQSLIAQRDNYLRQFKNSNGVISYDRKVKSNTIGDLQNDWQRTSNYYLDKKREYDDIALELEKLNTEYHNHVSELQYMGNSEEKVINLEGCWLLRTGKYLSQIEVSFYPSNGTYDGFLTVNNLENYSDGQQMFTVQWVSGGTYRGKEITFYVDNNGNTIRKEIPTKIAINSDGNFLIWTSDETVTMQRCN